MKQRKRSRESGVREAVRIGPVPFEIDLDKKTAANAQSETKDFLARREGPAPQPPHDQNVRPKVAVGQ